MRACLLNWLGNVFNVDCVGPASGGGSEAHLPVHVLAEIAEHIGHLAAIEGGGALPQSAGASILNISAGPVIGGIIARQVWPAQDHKFARPGTNLEPAHLFYRRAVMSR